MRPSILYPVMDPLKRLASAILIRALVDAQKGCPEAREWIIEDGSSPGFPFWCQVYGVEPISARQELRKAIKASPVKELAKEIRIERITQALTEHPELSNRELGRRLKVNYETVGRVRKQMPQAVPCFR